MAEHEPSIGATDDWYTPPPIFAALGLRFALDPCSPGPDHWVPADRIYTKANNGLVQPWQGLVFMNPPFGSRRGHVPWLKKFFAHGNGIALVPDRTSAPWWQRFASQAELLLFVSPKIKFLDASGQPGTSPAQGTSLLAVGAQGCAALHRAAANGLGVLMIPERQT